MLRPALASKLEGKRTARGLPFDLQPPANVVVAAAAIANESWGELRALEPGWTGPLFLRISSQRSFTLQGFWEQAFQAHRNVYP